MRPRRVGWQAHLHAAEAGPALVTGVLSRLNDLITERVLALMQTRYRLPPARWCWLGLGSEGRLEQTLSTDQDNGLIFSASDDGEARDLRELFLPFAQATNQALAQCGFPLCDGEVMGGNPRWCLSQSEWLESFSAWVRTPEPEALLNASIFFDFRPLAGDAGLAADLRGELGKLTRGNEIFLRMMTANALAAVAAAGAPARLCHRARVRRHWSILRNSARGYLSMRREFSPSAMPPLKPRLPSACAAPGGMGQFRQPMPRPSCMPSTPCKAYVFPYSCPPRLRASAPAIRSILINSTNLTADSCSKPCARRAACNSG
jgi:hypothetical protein